jgi:hypothetical protein
VIRSSSTTATTTSHDDDDVDDDNDDWIRQQLDHQHPYQPRIKVETHPFPQTMIVDQELIKKALLLASINDRVGGVVIFGGKGTGKLTDTDYGYAGSYREIVLSFPHSSINRSSSIHLLLQHHSQIGNGTINERNNATHNCCEGIQVQHRPRRQIWD